MPPAFATINVVDCALKEEASYGGGGALSNTTDGFELWLESKIASLAEIGYLQEGRMGLQLGGLGEAVDVPPHGFWVKAPLTAFFRGSGAAYSASVFCSLHRVLKAAGYAATLDAAPGTEKWTFTRTADGGTPTSLVAKLMDRSEEIDVDGAFCNLKIEASDGRPWKWMFDLIGRRSADIAARSFGAVTYGLQSVAIPLGAPAAITLGDFTAAVVRSFSYDAGRSIENARPNLNAAGYHAGYQPGPWATRITVLIEATSLVGSPYHTTSGLNVYKLRELATQIAVGAQLGTAQYNRIKVTWPKCQLVGIPQRAESNGVACWSLTLAPKPSSPIANDVESWVAD